MSFTWRSVGAGLVAWCLAFLVGYTINPVYLSLRGAVLFALSGMVGCLAVVSLGRRFSHSKAEQGAAALVFALTFLVGIYAPISAIWANAPFYSWVSALKTKPKRELLAPVVVKALERTAVTTYAGIFVLLALGYVTARWVGDGGQRLIPKDDGNFSHLGSWDAVFGFAALIVPLPYALSVSSADGTQINGFALLGLAFLQCFLFRSLRLECRSLWKQSARTEVRPLRKTAGAALILCSLLCTPFGLRLLLSCSDEKRMGKDLGLALMSVAVLLLPLVLYRSLAGESSENDIARSASYNHFATRCGMWSGLGFTLLLGGLVLTSLAKHELKAVTGQTPTPFALGIVALTPLFPSGGVLALLACCGGFFVALILPSNSARARDRILASAHGGAVGGAVFFVLLVILALSLGLGTVPCVPTKSGASDPYLTRLLFVDADWGLLGVFYLCLLFAATLAWASLWAIEAVFACGLIWLKDCFASQAAVTTAIPPLLPTKNPPLGPNA